MGFPFWAGELSFALPFSTHSQRYWHDDGCGRRWHWFQDSLTRHQVFWYRKNRTDRNHCGYFVCLADSHPAHWGLPILGHSHLPAASERPHMLRSHRPTLQWRGPALAPHYLRILWQYPSVWLPSVQPGCARAKLGCALTSHPTEPFRSEPADQLRRHSDDNSSVPAQPPLANFASTAPESACSPGKPSRPPASRSAVPSLSGCGTRSETLPLPRRCGLSPGRNQGTG